MDDQPRIRCIVLHEDDPNLKQNMQELVSSAQHGKIDTNSLIITVPSVESGLSTAGKPAGDESGSSSGDESETFHSAVHKLSGQMVSPLFSMTIIVDPGFISATSTLISHNI